MDNLDKLLSDMEKELNKSQINSTSANGIKPESYNSQNCDGDEIFLSTNTDVRYSPAEPNQISQDGVVEEIFLSTNTDARYSPAEPSQIINSSDGDEIFLSTSNNLGYSFTEPRHVSQVTSDGEISPSGSEVKDELKDSMSNS